MPDNHPSLLAFECAWIDETDGPNQPFIERFPTISARNLEHLNHQLREEGALCDIDGLITSHVTLHAVHHVSAEDGFTLTDLIWRKPDHDEFPCSYCDQLARVSWASQG
jgi:hypothetical protein